MKYFINKNERPMILTSESQVFGGGAIITPLYVVGLTRFEFLTSRSRENTLTTELP